jgi:hypothetical protein
MFKVNIAGAIRLPALIGVLCLLSVALTTPAHAANQRPTISGTPPASVYVGTEYYFQALGRDREGAVLRYSIQNKPSWASFGATTGVLSGTPTAPGVWSNVRITVSDGTSNSRALRFSIRATTSNNVAPVISGTPPTAVVASAAYYFVPTASDANGDPLRFNIINRPAWASFDTLTGRLSGTPDVASVGIYSNVTISVTDGATSVALAPFSITVSGSANRAPTLSGTPPAAVTAGQAYSFQPVAADADNDTLGFSIQNRPVWATFSSVTGRLAGTPAATNVGTYSNIVLSVSDGKASTALAAFTIAVVAAPNRGPTISGTPSTTVNADTAYSFRPTAADADGDTLTFSIANRPAWAAFDVATGRLFGTPAAASVGVYSNVVISVSDGKASAALAPFAITVADMSIGAASLTWTPPTANTDGSALVNLAGYRIAYGASATQLTQIIQIANAGLSSYLVENLARGTYYFTVRAYTSSGAESADSNVVTKNVQ